LACQELTTQPKANKCLQDNSRLSKYGTAQWEISTNLSIEFIVFLTQSFCLLFL
jgi:hypothetical protein